MKKHVFIQTGLFMVLMVLAASCSLPIHTSGDYYKEAPSQSNRYNGDVYSGRSNPIIGERDPYTGRYYPVDPGYYGGFYGAPAYPYGNRVYNNRFHNHRNILGRSNGYSRTPRRLQQSPAQRQPTPREREQAKEIILGKKRN